MKGEIIIDATGGMLGRIASFAAKEALKGRKVVIVNCNEALISGKRRNILEEYKEIRAKGGHSLKGPRLPKIPERILKRTIRGMLPHKQERGLSALRRVMCYNKTPSEFEGADIISMKKELKVGALKLRELSKEL
jgi:large subunit ribosomal protein L13